MIHNCLISIRDAFKNGKKMERKILNIVKAYDKSFYNKIYDREVLLNKEQLITLSKILQVNAPVFYSHIKNIIDREIKSLAFSDANSNESIVKNTKVSYEMLEEKTGKGQDWFITADEAVNLGICHGII